MRAELQEKIVGYLMEQGVEASASGSMVAVNRDSMCNSKFAKPGIPEEGTYPEVLRAIEAKYFYPLGYLWAFKNDDVIFLDTLGG